MDVGNFEKIHISKIRLLILEYLFIPALAVRCSFLNQINVGRVSKKQAEYFEDVTRGNPICEVTFVRLFLIEVIQTLYYIEILYSVIKNWHRSCVRSRVFCDSV